MTALKAFTKCSVNLVYRYVDKAPFSDVPLQKWIAKHSAVD